MSNFDEIIYAAQSIAKQGKEPTIALLKNRVKAPLPALIKGLKMWQQNPDKEINLGQSKETTSTKEANEQLSALMKEQINQQVRDEISAQLEQDISRKIEEKMQAQTEALTAQISKLEKEISKLKS